MDDIISGNDAAIDAIQHTNDDQSLLWTAGLQNFDESGAVSGQHDQWFHLMSSPATDLLHANFDTLASLGAVDQDLLFSFPKQTPNPSRLDIETGVDMPPPAIPTVTTKPRRRITEEMWDAQKQNIKALFISQRLTLSETMTMMHERHQFSAS
jgi:hypothetical protein